tara:strand:- start:15541 stop:15777 length:237 start_codon:yes stop_codon:yes gene_type:complete
MTKTTKNKRYQPAAEGSGRFAKWGCKDNTTGDFVAMCKGSPHESHRAAEIIADALNLSDSLKKELGRLDFWKMQAKYE